MKQTPIILAFVLVLFIGAVVPAMAQEPRDAARTYPPRVDRPATLYTHIYAAFAANRDRVEGCLPPARDTLYVNTALAPTVFAQGRIGKMIDLWNVPASGWQDGIFILETLNAVGVTTWAAYNPACGGWVN